MAYMNQERKAKLAANLKKVMPKGWKYSLSVRSGMTICLTISQAPVDLIEEVATRVSEPDLALRYQDRGGEIRKSGCVSVNPYWLENQFGASLPIFEAIKAALNDGNHDRSDVRTDYFDVGWYVDINIGRWDKPFVFAPVANLQPAEA